MSPSLISTMISGKRILEGSILYPESKRQSIPTGSDDHYCLVGTRAGANPEEKLEAQGLNLDAHGRSRSSKRRLVQESVPKTKRRKCDMEIHENVNSPVEDYSLLDLPEYKPDTGKIDRMSSVTNKLSENSLPWGKSSESVILTVDAIGKLTSGTMENEETCISGEFVTIDAIDELLSRSSFMDGDKTWVDNISVTTNAVDVGLMSKLPEGEGTCMNSSFVNSDLVTVDAVSELTLEASSIEDDETCIFVPSDTVLNYKPNSINVKNEKSWIENSWIQNIVNKI